MKLLRIALLVCLVALVAAPASAGTRIGGGVHYLKTVGDIKDNADFDENALGFLGSIAFTGGLFRFEADVEFIPDYAGSGELMIAPEGYALIGDLIYGGLGLGVGHLGDFGWQDPFFDLRAGVDFMAGSLDLDVFATYRFAKMGDLSGLGSDDANSVTFAALIRFGGK